eukprot:6197560-Pleurochrysis_carterae.AAC.4
MCVLAYVGSSKALTSSSCDVAAAERSCRLKDALSAALRLVRSPKAGLPIAPTDAAASDSAGSAVPSPLKSGSVMSHQTARQNAASSACARSRHAPQQRRRPWHTVQAVCARRARV